MVYRDFQIITKNIDKYDSFDFTKIISEIYGDKPDIQDIELVYYKLSDYLSLVNKVFNSLKENLTENNFLYYSNLFSISNENGNGQHYLSEKVEEFVQSIELETEEGLIKSEIPLRLIMNWLQIYGFFNTPTNSVLLLDHEKLNNLRNKLDALVSHQEENNLRRNILFDELENKKNDLDLLISSKTEELNQIKNKLDVATQNTNSINDLLTRSTETTTKINNLLDNFEQYTLDARESLNDEKKNHEEYKIILDTQLKTVDTKINEFNTKNEIFQTDLDFVESKKEFFEERNNYLLELIGREGGAALFETFRIRQKELEIRVEKYLSYVLWSCLVVFGITTGLFIYTIDKNNGTATWEIVISSVFKTIPLGVFLYFIIRQYIKERNYTEEYAFKAACALTVKSYRDILSEEAKQDDLIVKAVLDIYKTPFESQTKDEMPDKKIKEMFLNMTETAKNLSKK